MLFSRFVAPVVLISTGALAHEQILTVNHVAAASTGTPPTILTSVYALSNTTAALGTIVEHWTGTSISGLVGVIRVADKLTRRLRWAALVANASNVMTAQEAEQLGPAIIQLQTLTNTTLSSIVAHQRDFVKMGLTKTVRSALVQQAHCFAHLNNRVQVKLPQNMLSKSLVVATGFESLYASAVAHFATGTDTRHRYRVNEKVSTATPVVAHNN